MSTTGYQVTQDIMNAHPKMPKVPLIEDDLLTKDDDGTWRIECPGIMISGFVLTPEQEATLKEVEFEHDGLAYRILKEKTRG